MINNPLGLYLHIPYCIRKCRYCDFLSFPAASGVPEKYLDALTREIRYQGSRYAMDYVVQTVYIGGGTPSLLTKEQLFRLSREIRMSFLISRDAEWTIEVNPETLTRARADAFLSCGINRLSMGIQSLDDGLLKTLGRVHTAERARTAFRTARQAGFQNLSCDLMMGLPGQNLRQWTDTLDEVKSWMPEHISTYSLIVEENTPFYDLWKSGRLALPDEELERQMYHTTIQKLQAAGYQQYEISNFAKPGFESRHNLSYWIRTPYLGMGVGAASLIEEKRLVNERDPQRYMSAEVDEISSVEEILDQRARMDETMMLGFRMTKGISKRAFFRQFHCDPEDVYGETLLQLKVEGLITQEEDRIRLTDYGLDLANRVFIAFI